MRLVSARVIAVGYVRLESVTVGSPRHSDAARRADKLQFSVGASRLVVVCRESLVLVPRVVCLHLRFRPIPTYCGTCCYSQPRLFTSQFYTQFNILYSGVKSDF